jgi:hypothetical protein
LVDTPVWQQTIRRGATIDVNDILSDLGLSDEADSDEQGEFSDPS